MISRFIVRREFGHDRPTVLQSAERTRRTFAIELSQNKTLEVCHRAGIHALDIDPSEGKYLLTGSQDRSVAVYDIHARQSDHGPALTDDDANEDADTTGPGSNKLVPKLHQIENAHKFSVETVQVSRPSVLFSVLSRQFTYRAHTAENASGIPTIMACSSRRVQTVR
eukprot:m.31532 g.31532  ORF g.31532 m.31532 type:complete len:167 (-) comp12331_c0_seq3:1056-1556(-)